MIQDLSSLPVPVVEAGLSAVEAGLPVVEAGLPVVEAGLSVVEAVLLPVVEVLIMYRKEWELWVTLTARCSHSATTNSVTHTYLHIICTDMS